MIKEILAKTEKLEADVAALSGSEEEMAANAEQIRQMLAERNELLSRCIDLKPEDRVFLARHPQRPHIDDFIQALFTDFLSRRVTISMTRTGPFSAALPATRACL